MTNQIIKSLGGGTSEALKKEDKKTTKEVGKTKKDAAE
jgi:hypothetical protein